MEGENSASPEQMKESIRVNSMVDQKKKILEAARFYSEMSPEEKEARIAVADGMGRINAAHSELIRKAGDLAPDKLASSGLRPSVFSQNDIRFATGWCVVPGGGDVMGMKYEDFIDPKYDRRVNAYGAPAESDSDEKNDAP